jgi:hypothetical protein
MAEAIKGIVAGALATTVVSGVVLLQGVVGVAPQLGLIGLLLRALDAPPDLVLGWLLHFLMGSILGGLLFAWLEPRLEADSSLKRGVLFALGLWLFFMLVVMPAAGAGLFGFGLSPLAPLAILLLHLVYGLVLGWTFGRLTAAHEALRAHGRHQRGHGHRAA